MLVQLGLVAALSRLLSPTDFGLMASAALALRFVTYFVQFGLGPALIQRQDLEPGHVSAAWLVATGIGLAGWLCFLLLGGLAASYFREPRLEQLLLVLPATMLLGSLAAVPLSLLRREMRFKDHALVDFVSLTLGYGGVGLVSAWMGWGVWSLVWAQIAQQLVALGIASWLAGGPLGPVRWQHIRDLGGYGSRYSLVGFLDFISSNVETLFIGRVLGAAQLGVYNRAQAVSTVAVDQFMGAVGRVMFPTLSGLRGDPAALARTLVIAMSLTALLTFPLATALSLLSNELVSVALGDRWEQAAPVVAMLVWSIPCAYLSTFLGSTFDALALFRRKTAMILLVTFTKILLMLLLQGQGLPTLMAALVLAEWLRVGLAVLLLRNQLPIGLPSLGMVMLRGAASALSVAVTLALGHKLLEAGGIRSDSALLVLSAFLALAGGLPTCRWLLSQVIREAQVQGVELTTLRRMALL